MRNLCIVLFTLFLVLIPVVSSAVKVHIDSAGCVYIGFSVQDVTGNWHTEWYSTGGKDIGSNGVGPCPDPHWKGKINVKK